jgi:hypothetical protein
MYVTTLVIRAGGREYTVGGRDESQMFRPLELTGDGYLYCAIPEWRSLLSKRICWERWAQSVAA